VCACVCACNLSSPVRITNVCTNKYIYRRRGIYIYIYIYACSMPVTTNLLCLTHIIRIVSAGVFESRCLSTTTSPSWPPTRCSRWRQAMRPSAGERRLAPRPSLRSPPRTYFEIIALHSLQSLSRPIRNSNHHATLQTLCLHHQTAPQLASAHNQPIALACIPTFNTSCYSQDREDRHLYLWQHSSLSLSHTPSFPSSTRSLLLSSLIVLHKRLRSTCPDTIQLFITRIVLCI
jgi:hypothetical protein